MLPVPDVVRCTNDDRPRPGRGAGDDGLVWLIGGDDLKLWPITAIKDGAVIDAILVGIDRGEVPPVQTKNKHFEPLFSPNGAENTCVA